MSQPAALPLLGPGVLLEALTRLAREPGAHGADELELSFEGGVLGTSRLARSQLTQTGDVVERMLRVRARVGDRVGAAHVASLADAPAAIARAVEAARALASLPGPAAPPLPDPAPPEAAGSPGATRLATAMARSFRGETAELGAAGRADLARRALTPVRAAGCHAAGVVAIAVREQAVASTRGIKSYHRVTSAKLDIIATRDDDDRATGRASTVVHDASRLDATAQAEHAAETAQRSAGAIVLPPGEYDVVLEPPAVAELMEWMALASFGSQGFRDGSSCLHGRAGEALCDPAITIYDDGLDADPDALVTPSDPEGVRKQRVVLIDAGRAGTPVLDTAGAVGLGHPASAATGHAGALDDSWALGSVAHNLAMAAGEDSFDALLGRVDRGLYIKRFHYVNGLLDTRRALMTGMTRSGCFLIEQGRLGAPVHNLRWTQGILEAFGRVGGVTRQRRTVPVWWSAGGGILAPALLLRRFRFTGASARD